MRIRLEHLSRKYQDTLAVDDLNVEIEDGFLVCLLGPSGCGKSTTLSMLAGLETPTEGSIFFDGVEINEVEAENRDIGMVFQDYALYPHMTVAENIAFPLKMKGIKKKDRMTKVKEIARLMQIEELLLRKPAKLSGGQQQRVAIARALVKEPKLLLLDEPLSNLDARLRIELREEIRRLQKQLGLTTVFVTHDQEEAMSISDRILLMHKGCLIQYDTPRNLYWNPANAFAGHFLGNPPMNLVKGSLNNGRVKMDLMQIELTAENTSLHMAVYQEEKQDEASVNAAWNENVYPVIIGIRPEDLILQISPKTGANAICGNVLSIQTLGKELYVRFQAGNNTLLACTAWDEKIKEGENAFFVVRRAHVFSRSEIELESSTGMKE